MILIHKDTKNRLDFRVFLLTDKQTHTGQNIIPSRWWRGKKWGYRPPPHSLNVSVLLSSITGRCNNTSDSLLVVDIQATGQWENCSEYLSTSTVRGDGYSVGTMHAWRHSVSHGSMIIADWYRATTAQWTTRHCAACLHDDRPPSLSGLKTVMTVQ